VVPLLDSILVVDNHWDKPIHLQSLQTSIISVQEYVSVRLDLMVRLKV